MFSLFQRPMNSVGYHHKFEFQCNIFLYLTLPIFANPFFVINQKKPKHSNIKLSKVTTILQDDNVDVG